MDIHKYVKEVKGDKKKRKKNRGNSFFACSSPHERSAAYDCLSFYKKIILERYSYKGKEKGDQNTCTQTNAHIYMTATEKKKK